MQESQGLSTREIAGHEDSEDRASIRESEDRGPIQEAEDRAAIQDDTDREPDRPATSDQASSTGDLATESPALLPQDESTDFQGRWEHIQTGFVDQPRRTVEQADELVAQVMQRLAEGFAAERERLEEQWGRGEDVSTEDLRIALQRYRSFFQRLLSA
jgi:hypothetical protein